MHTGNKAIRVLMVTGNYLPAKNGGIENYTHWLSSLLIKNNYEVEVAALTVKEAYSYNYEGVYIHYLNNSFAAFESVLQDGNFDICHFQEYSEFGGIELPWFDKAKAYCKKIFFTFHLPYLTCYKGDFRYNGVEDCSTFSESKRCVSCVIADKAGYKKMGSSSLYLSFITALMNLSGKTARLEAKITTKYKKLESLVAICDAIFIYAGWFKNILDHNGFALDKIRMIPYKTQSIVNHSDISSNTIKNKILFVGRIQEQKGLHLLCNAMNKLDAAKGIELDVYGNIIEKEYFDDCVKEYPFNFKGTLSYRELLKELRNYDFLILPSVFTEMFSLIIKDSFYEKLPVIGSSAKGNKDAIEDGKNGFLFEYDNAKDLAGTIDKAYHLKINGWEPEFKKNGNPEKDIEEMLSYYVV